MITGICRVLAAVTAVATVISVFYILNEGGQFFGGNGVLGLLVVASFFLSVSAITWACGEIYEQVSGR